MVDQYTTRAAQLGRGANDWSRRELGVDVVGTASGAWSSVRGGAGGPGGQGGYGRVGGAGEGGDGWGSYQDDDDMLHHTGTAPGAQPGANKPSDWDNDDWDKGWSATPVDSATSTSTSTKPAASKAPTAPAKKDDGWEDW